MSPDYLAGFIAGQWRATEVLMNRINSFVGHLRRQDMYRMMLEYKPQVPDDLDYLCPLTRDAGCDDDLQ